MQDSGTVIQAGEFIVRLYLVDDKSMVIYDQSIDDVRFKVEFDYRRWRYELPRALSTPDEP